MKRYFNKIAFCATLLGLFASCEVENETTDLRVNKPIITADQVNYTITEGESATVNLTVNTPYYRGMTLKLEVIGGDASFRDITTPDGVETIPDTGFGKIGYELSFPANSSTYSFDIAAVADLLTEGQEVLKLRLYGAGNANGIVEPASETITLTINDVVSTDFGIELAWGQDVTDSFGTITPGEYIGTDDAPHEYQGYDFDFWVENSNGMVIDGYAAATGAQPEMEILDGSSLADDTFYVYVDRYAAGFTPKEVFSKKVYLTLSKIGVFTTVVEIPFISNVAYSDYAVAFTKSGTTYTVNDINTNEVLASGRKSNVNVSGRNLKRGK